MSATWPKNDVSTGPSRLPADANGGAQGSPTDAASAIDMAALAEAAPSANGDRPTRTAPSPLDQLIATYRRHLHLPDPGPLYAVLGTVAANRMPGDPVWLMLVG